MDSEAQIINLLQTFGLTGNECRAYLSLLKRAPATGYEISASSGIPRSAIYAVLAHLEAMNIINGLGEKPRRFIPISPDTLADHFTHKTEQNLDELRVRLNSLEAEVEDLDFWHIKGYDNMILKARETIHKSGSRLYLSIWKTEFLALEEDLNKSIDRGVDVTIFSFCQLPAVKATVVSYGLNEEELRQAWKPSLILVADNRDALMGGARRIATNQVVWTNNPSIADLAINHIILDITLAGQRLDRDINPIVAPMMEGLKVDLDSLIQQTHPHGHQLP